MAVMLHVAVSVPENMVVAEALVARPAYTASEVEAGAAPSPLKKAHCSGRSRPAADPRVRVAVHVAGSCATGWAGNTLRTAV